MLIFTRARVASLATCALLGATFLVVEGMGSSSAETVQAAVAAPEPGLAAAESVLAEAIVVRQTSTVPPGDRPPLATAEGATDVARASSFRPTVDEARAMVEAGQADLAEVFSGSALAAEEAKLRTAAEILPGGEVLVLGGGADTFEFSEPTVIDAGTVRLATRARVWAEFAQIQGDSRLAVARPVNIIDFVATMTATESGGWTVSELSWEFAPGGGP